MIASIILGALISIAHNGTRNFDECKAENFKSKSCYESERLYKAGKYLCKIQGKKFLGRAGNNGCAK